ncbi:1862_t:CDS:2, partial [Acaulospora colombiana]
TTTELFGLAVHPNPRHHLLSTYKKTLESLTQIPPTAVYRQATEALTQYRLSIVESNEDVKEIENKIGAGIIEEVIWQAEDELKLFKYRYTKLDNIHYRWEPLEDPPPKGQWQYEQNEK